MEPKEIKKRQMDPERDPVTDLKSDRRSGSGKGYNNKRTLKDWLVLALWILAVIGVGMFALNQAFNYFYKIEFLKSPCMLCGELNPEVQTCINELNTRASYPDGEGGWTDPFHVETYNITLP